MARPAPQVPRPHRGLPPHPLRRGSLPPPGRPFLPKKAEALLLDYVINKILPKNRPNSSENVPLNNKNNIFPNINLTIVRRRFPFYCEINKIQKKYIPIIHKLICNLCKELIFCPIKEKCDRLFCEKCYEIFYPNFPFKKNQINKKLTKKPFEINDFQLIENELNLNYQNEINIPENRNNEHKFECLFEFNKCNHDNCPYDIIKRNIEIHKKNCVYRFENCKFCNEKIQFIDFEKHYKICKKILVDCVLNCGKKVIREQMNNHMTIECGNYNINCKYKKYGCDFSCLRKNMDIHYKEKCEKHLSLYEKYMRKFIPFIVELENNNFNNQFLKKKRNNKEIISIQEENIYK